VTFNRRAKEKKGEAVGERAAIRRVKKYPKHYGKRMGRGDAVGRPLKGGNECRRLRGKRALHLPNDEFSLTPKERGKSPLLGPRKKKGIIFPEVIE